MIGKGRFFDIISRTADDVNNIDITIYNMIENFKIREEKYVKQKSENNEED